MYINIPLRSLYIIKQVYIILNINSVSTDSLLLQKITSSTTFKDVSGRGKHKQIEIVKNGLE